MGGCRSLQCASPSSILVSSIVISYISFGTMPPFFYIKWLQFNQFRFFRIELHPISTQYSSSFHRNPWLITSNHALIRKPFSSKVHLAHKSSNRTNPLLGIFYYKTLHVPIRFPSQNLCMNVNFKLNYCHVFTPFSQLSVMPF